MSTAKTILEAETPKSAIKHFPTTNFYVDWVYENWHVKANGDVITYATAQAPPTMRRWHNIKKFDVDEYRKRTGRSPSGTVQLSDIGYFTHGGERVACRAERRLRQ